MTDVRVCSNCGTPCGIDSRIGAVNHYLTCSCDKGGYWVQDRIGGYWENGTNARPVTPEEYARQRRQY